MCIIIDVNTIPSVFKNDAKDHFKFQQIEKLIIGRSKVKWVSGGSTYLKEIKALHQYYVKFYNTLKDQGKVHEANKEDVDKEEAKIISLVKQPGFNDHHIIAIVIVSNCKLVCSYNKKHHSIIRNRYLYPTKRPPKIYTGSPSSQKLLSNRQLINNCGPCSLH